MTLFRDGPRIYSRHIPREYTCVWPGNSSGIRSKVPMKEAV